ncbi:hypothetical protein AB0O20_29285 [Streptomyces kronopolitis]|uniref:hypothetical protein n=1 Tax=Streptomyces kronopolitis TaxID=1612435 RepID=UPI003417907F
MGTHILSLPEGAAVDIRSLAARFPEGRDRIAFALRELEAYGYVERVRERTADGRVLTRTYGHHAPGVPEEARAVRAPQPPPVPPLPPGRETTPDDPCPPGPQPFQTCDGCERACRAREPGRCRDCRPGPASGEAVDGPAVAA